MVDKKYGELGRALNDNLFVGLDPYDARRKYRQSLSRPDILVFHGTPGQQDAEDRFRLVESDLENLHQEDDVSGTPLLLFRGEYENLGQQVDSVVEDYGLELEVSDFGPYPAYQDWIPVEERTEPGDAVRSYTSKSNQPKLERTAEIILGGREVTVFGIESESDSFVRKMLGEADYLVRQRRGALSYAGED